MLALKSYLDENNFTLDVSNAKQKYKCGICKGILCVPKTSKCGCSFCENCIKTYIEIGDILKCPNCSKEFEVGMALSDDYRAEIKVLEFIIKCPKQFCEQKVKLSDMKEHIESCVNAGVKCVLSELGCLTVTDSNSAMNAHIESQVGKHLNMIVDKFNRQENSIVEQTQIMHQEITELVNEVKRLNENREIPELKNEVSELKNEIRQLNDNLAGLTNRVENNEYNIENILTEMRYLDYPKYTWTFLDISDYEPEFTPVFELESYNFKIKCTHVNDENEIKVLVYLVPGSSDDKLTWPMDRDMRLEVWKSNRIHKEIKFFSSSDSTKTSGRFYNKPTREFYLKESRMTIDADEVLNDDNDVTVTLRMLE